MNRLSDIRPGRSADLPAVHKLLEHAGLPTAGLSTPNLRMWIMEAGEAVIGTVALERFGTEALLRSLTVVPEYRKLGIGRQLVTRVEQDARADGVRRFVLLTETAESFFRSLGYSVIDRELVSEGTKRSAEFHFLCPVSATCMSKNLYE